MSQRADLAFGIASEEAHMSLLQDYLDTTLERKGGYATFDFENPERTIFVELKSRRIPHDRYDTAIIGFNKVAFADHMEGVQFHFVFCYTDGLYTIQYNKEQFDSFEVRDNYVRGARNDTHNKPQKVVLIPTNLLTKIEPRPTVVVEETPAQVEDQGDEKEEEPYFYQ